jgi:hypothetical protein
VLEAARDLKRAGLPWSPHAGCFVWDPDEAIPAPSPFPNRVYFVLNLGRFTDLLGSMEAVREWLVWVPTWTQAQALQAAYGAESSGVIDSGAPAVEGAVGDPAAVLVMRYRAIQAVVSAQEGRT